jgi:hypothetical protein
MKKKRIVRPAAAIGLREVRKAIDRAESNFRSCWKMLVGLKDRPPNVTPRLREFQPTLAESLYELEETYRKVVEYRDWLIGRKRGRADVWTIKRLRLLDRYRTALEETMAIGKSIGDAFAWLFYHNSPDILRKHVQRPGTRHFPTGVGGRGEVEFIRHARAEGHLLLHHSITTFLRVGDVSFVDPRTWSVTGLGELKSHTSRPGEVNISLVAIANTATDLPRLLTVPGALQQGSRRTRPPSPPGFDKRLRQQTSQMSATLARQEAGANSEFFNGYHVEELAKLARDVLKRSVAYSRVGPGVVLLASRPYRGSTLSSRLLTNQTGESIVSRFKLLPDIVRSTCDPQSAENSVAFSELTTTFSWGGLPFFWWPVDACF